MFFYEKARFVREMFYQQVWAVCFRSLWFV